MSAAIVSALIGAAGSLLAVYIAFLLPQKRRREERIANLREQGAQVIEPVRNLLEDILLEDIYERPPGDTEAVESLSRRWKEDLRDPLVAWGMGQGSAEVSQLSLDLRDAVGAALRSARAGKNEADPATETDTLADARGLIAELRVAIGVASGVRTRSGARFGAGKEGVPSGWR